MNGEIIQPSDFEQQEWFIHQQQLPPAQHGLAWQLGGTLDTDRLERGLVALVAASPCLNLRYRFDDHTGLIKTTDSAALPPVSRHLAVSVQQALAAVALQQTTPFDLHHSAPVRLMLFCLPDGGAVLGIVLHQILAEQLSWPAICSALTAAYQGEAAQLPAAAAADLSLATTDLQATLVLDGVTSQPLALAATAPQAEQPGVVTENSAVVTAILSEFRDALAMPQMRAEDDFFDQGGHSLIATRVIGRLLSLHQIEVNINDLFSYPTAQGLAAQAKQRSQPVVSAAALTPATFSSESAPLSLAQQSLWKIYAAMGYSDIFNLPFVLRFVDEVDEELLHQAMHDVLVRHAGLRTLFIQDNEGVRQRIVPDAELSRYRWFWSSASAEQKPASTVLAQEAAHLFDLARELPLRLRFVRDAASGQQLLSLLFHHMVLDEWSLNLMMDDLQHAYQARAADQLPEWKEPAIPFHEFAIGQHHSGLGQQHLNYWLDKLRGVPLGKPIFSGQISDTIDTAADVSGSNLEFTLPAAVTAGLYALSKQHSASLFNVVYGGIATALHFLGGAADMVIGTSASGRNDARYFDTIGYFTTVVAHRLRFDQAPTLASLIGQVKNTINDSMPHTDVPIDLVEEALLGEGAREDAHMFEVFIQIHSRIKLNGVITLQDGREIAYRQVDGEKSESILGLQFEIMEEWEAGEKSLRLMMTYRSDHYTPAQVEKITATIQALLGLFASQQGSDPQLAVLKQALSL